MKYQLSIAVIQNKVERVIKKLTGKDRKNKVCKQDDKSESNKMNFKMDRKLRGNKVTLENIVQSIKLGCHTLFWR